MLVQFSSVHFISRSLRSAPTLIPPFILVVYYFMCCDLLLFDIGYDLFYLIVLFYFCFVLFCFESAHLSQWVLMSSSQIEAGRL